jgi:hypothetical protein
MGDLKGKVAVGKDASWARNYLALPAAANDVCVVPDVQAIF